MHRSPLAASALLPFAALALGLHADAQSAIQYERFKLVASDGAPFDHFGASVARSDSTIVIGAPDDDDLADRSGAVYVFTKIGGTWVEQAKLVAPDGAAGDAFGTSVAIDGDTLAGGAFENDGAADQGGAVYVFTRVAGVWSFQAKLIASDTPIDARLGISVDLSGDTLVAGAAGDDALGEVSGSAYVFVRAGATWSQQAKLTPSDGTDWELFGSAVAIDGDRLLVGAPTSYNGIHGGPGSGYVFMRSGASWSEEQKLTVASTQDGDGVGTSVDLEGDRALLGAPYAFSRGSAFLFERAGTTWSQAAWINPLGQVNNLRFGVAVALEGDQIAGGANGLDFAFTGCAYVFGHYGQSWMRQWQLRASDAAIQDELGTSIAFEEPGIAVGAWKDDDGGSESGSVYVFDRPVLSVGTAYCFGDGSGTPCPCNNDSAPGAGQGCQNLSGVGSQLATWGSTSVSADDLVFGVLDIGVVTSAVLFMGSNAVNGGNGNPLGEGLFCAAGITKRLGVRTSDGFSQAYWGPGLGGFAGWQTGETKRFQIWYRNPQSQGVCGLSFNLSSAMELVFGP